MTGDDEDRTVAGGTPGDSWTDEEDTSEPAEPSAEVGGYELDEVAQGGSPDDPWTRSDDLDESPEADPVGPTATGAVPGTPLRWTRAAWGVGILVGLGGLVGVAYQVRSVTIPLLVAFTIAYLLDPVVDWFEARGISRTVAIVILLTTFLGGVAGVTVLVVPQVVREFALVPEKLGEALERGVPLFEERFELEVPENVQDVVELVRDELEKIDMKKLLAPAGSIVKGVYGGTASLFSFVIGFVMIPLFAFYLLRDFDLIVGRVHSLLPSSYRESISARFREIDQAMSSFIRGQLTVAAILAVLYSVGLAVLGVPLASVVGILAGVGNMVPYLGTTLGLGLATVMTLLDWQGPGHLAMVYGVFVVVQLLESSIITPKVVGESVGLSAFVVILAVLVFGELFGFFGILIAVPLAAILNILLRALVEAYEGSDFFESH